MRKRILVSLLTLVMVLSLMPMPALAVEDDGDVEEAVVCTLDENCEAETHVEGCPRYVAPEEPADSAEVLPAEEQEDDIMPLDGDDDTTDEQGPWNISAGDGDDVIAYLTVNNNDAENSTYTLTISGSGGIRDYDKTNDVPWASYCTKITSVVLSEGITGFGGRVLQNTGITTLELPSSISDIDSWSISGCDELESITVSENNPDFISVDGVLFSKDMKELVKYPVAKAGTFYAIPQETEKICSGSIYYCKYLTSIDLSAVTTIEDYALEGTPIKTITIPETVRLSTRTLFGMSELNTVTILGSPTEIPQSFFERCSSLKSFSIPESVMSIGRGAFAYSGLESISIPPNVTSIGDGAFRGCTSLKSVILPKSLQTLDMNVFRDVELIAAYIPNSVTKILTAVFNKTNVVYAETQSVSVLLLRSGKANIGTDTIIAVTNGGIFADDFTFTSDTLDTPTKEGYIFGGWYADPSDGSGKLGETDSPAKGTTYYAEWNSTITFDANGGTSVTGMEAQTIAETDTSTKLTKNTYTRDGYEFSGWNTAANGSGTSYEDEATGAGTNGSITLYAQWTKEIGEDSSYTVNAILDQTYTGAEIKPAVVVKNGDTVLDSGYTVEYFDNTNVGTAKATVTVNGASVDLAFQIVKDENPTVEMAGKSVTYGDPYTMTATAKTSAGNQITGDDIISIEYYTDEACEQEWTGAGGETQPTAASTYYVKAVLKETDNYASKFIVATLTISKGEFSVTAEDYARAYDGKAHSITVNAGDAAVTYSTAEAGPYDEKNPTFTDAGVYTVYYIARKENYEDRAGHATVNITKAPLTATYVSEAIQYGQTPALTVSVTGFVNGESADTALGYAAPTVSADYTNVGQYTLTPAGGEAANYTFNCVPGMLEITSADYPVSISADKPLLSSGGTVTFTVNADAAIQVAGLTCDDAGITVTDNGDGTYSAVLPNAEKTYTFTVDVAGDMSNYEGGPAACTVSVTYKSTGSSSSSSSGTYAVTVDSTKNGTVAISPKNASKGTTVTITVKPNSGYKLDDLTVTDKNGDTVKVKGQGDNKYIFTMPASKVTVEASFTKIAEQPSVTFADVSASAYYYDAVAWAVENRITYGTSATTFSPDLACTRAQAVTFLWRAAGSPAPKSSVNPFADVSTSAYYYDAVLWAVEQGITVGTSATTFSPATTCTRGQIVTFLYRAEGTATTGSNPFTDVSDSAYYVDAVKWAVAESVTAGTSATTFSPDASCTRAQIVTFLYRAEA